MSLLTFLLLTACDAVLGGGSSGEAPPPSAPPPAAGPAPVVGKVTKITPEGGSGTKPPLIQQGVDSSLPWPEPMLTADQCDGITDGGPVSEGCFSGKITCDESIVGHTRGGVDLFNTRWWERNFCWPGTVQHDGGDERLYKFSFPDDGEWRAWFTLDSPCADLDMMVFEYDGSSCPNAKTDSDECDSQRKDGTKRERAEAVTDGKWRHWVVVVEGVGDAEGAFALTAQCRKGVR